MINLSSWLPGLTDDDEEDDPVKRALRALGQGASAVTGAAQGLYDRRAAEVAAAPQVDPAPPTPASMGSPLSSLVEPPTAPSPFAPAGTPGVYVEPEEERVARGQAIMAPIRAAGAAAADLVTTPVPEAGGRRVP